MATNNGTAEIVNMEDARARMRAAELDPEGFPDAGVHLRGVREAAGLSLDDVAARTHIKASYLKAIEDLEIDALPTRAFAVGFVKTYAEALGLDPDAVAMRFKAETGQSAPVEVDAEKFEAAEAAASHSERKELSLWAVFVIVAFIIWCALQISRPHGESTPFGLAVKSPPPAEKAPAAPPQDAPLTPSSRVVNPVLIERIEPVYPQRCESGAQTVETVEVAFNITRGGVVTGERVAKSTNSCFDEAALNAVRRWRYSPRTVDGEAAPAYDQRHAIRFEKPQ